MEPLLEARAVDAAPVCGVCQPWLRLPAKASAYVAGGRFLHTISTCIRVPIRYTGCRVDKILHASSDTCNLGVFLCLVVSHGQTQVSLASMTVAAKL